MDFWVCRKCGTPNHPSGTICRGALSIDRPRWVRTVHPLLSDGPGAYPRQYRTVKMTRAYRFKKGRPHELEQEPRSRSMNLADGIFQPYVSAGEGMGQWVVLCDGTRATTYGGIFLERGDYRPNGRATAIFRALTRDEGVQDYYEGRTDQQITTAIRDELEADSDVLLDKLRVFYDRWVALWHTAGYFKHRGEEDAQKRVESEANAIIGALRTWIQQSLERPQPPLGTLGASGDLRRLQPPLGPLGHLEPP